jgi:hypothetical protein
MEVNNFLLLLFEKIYEMKFWKIKLNEVWIMVGWKKKLYKNCSRIYLNLVKFSNITLLNEADWYNHHISSKQSSTQQWQNVKFENIIVPFRILCTFFGVNANNAMLNNGNYLTENNGVLCANWKFTEFFQ